MRASPIVKRLLVLLSTIGLVGAAFLATTPGVVGFVANPPCTSANVTSTSDPYAAANVGWTVTFTASSTGCNQPAEYQFLLQAPGGTLISKRAYSTTATYAWDTSGLLPGNWNLVVRARAAGTAVVYDAYFIGTFALVVNRCQSISTADDYPQSAPIGTSITFTASPVGCPLPEVGFLLLAPGGTWQVMRAYSPILTWKWDTTGYRPGLYQIAVWARQKYSREKYDIYDIVTVFLPSAIVVKCPNAYIQLNAASPQPAGTSVVFTANALCDAPTFEFWMLKPGGAWKIVQPYQAPASLNSGVTYAWDTTGLANGLYRIGIWERTSGSTSPYEVYANMSYFIGS